MSLKVLIVKLSSLGDVVHTLPVVQDIRRALPQARIDWVVERGFAPLAQRSDGVHRVIACELRRWRKSPFSAATRAQWRAFRAELAQEAYDAVIDAQGLTKSALIARLARMAPNGKRYALANRTDGSSWEAPTRWVADVALRIAPHVHAVQRSRELCARALGYAVPPALHYGLRTTPAVPEAVAPSAAGQVPASAAGQAADAVAGCVAFVHGSSRADKCWPRAHWLTLGQRLIAGGHTLALPHGSQAELQEAQALAQALGPAAQVWPRLDLAALTDRLAGCVGVIGVDSGLSHIAVALDLPHVQIYNFDTAWRTGPQVDAGQGEGQGEGSPSAARQCSVFGQPQPAVDAVWQAWQRVWAVRAP